MTDKATKTLEIINGELTKKEEKKGSNEKPYWILEISGHGKASIPSWKAKVAEGLTVGKSYEYECEKDDKFTNIVSVKEITPEPKAELPKRLPLTREVIQTPAEHKESYISQPKNDIAIMAQVALKSAVERANGIVGRELLTREVIQIGQEYFNAMRAWSQGKTYTPSVSKTGNTTTAGPEAPPEVTQGQTDRLPTLHPDYIKAVQKALNTLGVKPANHDKIVSQKFPGANTIAQLTMAEAEKIIASVPKNQPDELPFEEM